jgi:hypothetical protein
MLRYRREGIQDVRLFWVRADFNNERWEPAFRGLLGRPAGLMKFVLAPIVTLGLRSVR